VLKLHGLYSKALWAMELLINYCRKEEHCISTKPTKLCLFFKSFYFPVQQSGREFAGRLQVICPPWHFSPPCPVLERGDYPPLRLSGSFTSGIISSPCQLRFITANNTEVCWPDYLLFWGEWKSPATEPSTSVYYQHQNCSLSPVTVLLTAGLWASHGDVLWANTQQPF